MPCDNTEEPFKALSSAFDDFFRKPVGEDLPRQRWDVHPGRLMLKNISEGFKIRVPPTNKRVTELESGYIGL